MGLSPDFAQTSNTPSSNICETVVSQPVDTGLTQMLQKLGLPNPSTDDFKYNFLVFLERIRAIDDVHTYDHNIDSYINSDFDEYLYTFGVAEETQELRALALSNIWRANPHTRGILSTFADKVQTLRSRKPPSHLSDIENRLITEIFRILIIINRHHTDNVIIPQPLIRTIYSLDTLSYAEMFTTYHWINKAAVTSLNGDFNFEHNKAQYEIEWYNQSLYQTSRSLRNVVTTLRTNMPEEGLLGKISLIDDEAQMRREGYSEDYIAGLEKGAKAGLELAHILRSRQIDPRTTHVPELIPFARTWINFAEERLNAQTFPDKEVRLSHLESLRAEMQARQAIKQITYEWWLYLGLRISLLMTSRDLLTQDDPDDFIKDLPTIIKKAIPKGWITNDELEALYNDNDHHLTFIREILDQFPENILIPTVHELGIIPINATAGTGVHLIGLNEDISFFFHDIFHAINNPTDKSQFITTFRLKMRDLSKSERERNEYIFFVLTNEVGISFPIQIERVRFIEEIEEIELFFRLDRSTTIPHPERRYLPYNFRILDQGPKIFLEWAISDFLRTLSEVNAAIDGSSQE